MMMTVDCRLDSDWDQKISGTNYFIVVWLYEKMTLSNYLYALPAGFVE